MVKVFTVVIAFLITISGVFAQVSDPVTWSSESTIDQDEVVIKITAEIENGWSIYSQFTDKGGPIPTSFEYPSNLELIGKTSELSEVKSGYDDLFELNVKKFDHQAIFEQRVKHQSNKDDIKGIKVTYMSCNDQSCLPPKTIIID